MAEQQQYKPGQGRAFPAKNKTEDWHADWEGRIVLPNGEEYYFSVADRVGQSSGNPYKEVRITRPVQNGGAKQTTSVQNRQPQSAAQPIENISDLDDDLPF